MNTHQLLFLILESRELNKSQIITKSNLEKAENFAASKPAVAEKLLAKIKEQKLNDEEKQGFLVSQLDGFASPENKPLIDQFKQEFFGVASDPEKPAEQIEQSDDPLYQRLLILCKLFYQIEHVGDPEIHARKLATVFNDFDTALDYLKFIAAEKKGRERIVHDACLVTLPQASFNLEVWQALARRHYKDLRFWKTLPQGAELEKLMEQDIKDGKTPQLSEVKTLSGLYTQTYKAWLELKKHRTELDDDDEETFKNLNIKLNELKLKLAAAYAGTKLTGSTSIEVLDAYLEKYLSESDPGFQNFIYHGLTKADYARFNDLKCVNDDKQIPNLGLDGEVLGYKGFYIMKVDVTDRLQAMRACYLGKLTSCCQSLSGEAGQPCVIHGLTSPYGGFYVLCQGDISHPTIDDRLLAGCWVWRAKSGALVIDSEEITDEALSNEDECTMVIKMVEHHAFELVRQGYCDSVCIGAFSGISHVFGFPLKVRETHQDYRGYSDATEQRSLFSKHLPAHRYLDKNKIMDQYLLETLKNDFDQVETLTPILVDLFSDTSKLLSFSRKYLETSSNPYAEALYNAYSNQTTFNFTKKFSEDAQELEDILIAEALNHPDNLQYMVENAFNCQNIAVLRKIAEHPAVRYNDAFSTLLAQQFFNAFDSGKAKSDMKQFLLEFFSEKNFQFQDILFSKSSGNEQNFENILTLLVDDKLIDALSRLSKHEGLQVRFAESLQKRDLDWLFSAVVENQLIPLDKLNFDTTLFDSYLQTLVPDLTKESTRAGIPTRRLPGRAGLFVPAGRQREQLATVCAPLNENIEKLKALFPDRQEELEKRLKTFFLESSGRMRALMYSRNGLLKNIRFDSAPLTSSHEIKDNNLTSLIKTTKTELTMDSSVLVSYYSDRLEELGDWLLQNRLIDETGKQVAAFTYTFSDEDQAFSNHEFKKLAAQKLSIDPEERRKRVSIDTGESSLEFKRQFMEYYSDRKDEAKRFLEECCLRHQSVASNWLNGNLGYDLFRDADFNSSQFYSMVHNLILTNKSNSLECFRQLETHFAHRIDEFKAFISEKFNDLETLSFAIKHNLPYLKDCDLTYVINYVNWDRPDTYLAAREYFKHRSEEFDKIMLERVQGNPATLALAPFVFNQFPGIEQLDFNNQQFIMLLEGIVYDPTLMGLVRQYFSSRAEELEQCISSIKPNYGSFYRPEDFRNQINRAFYNTLETLDKIIAEDNPQKLSAFIKLTGFDVNRDLGSFYSDNSEKSGAKTLLETAYSRRSVNCVATLLTLGAKVSDDTMKLASKRPLVTGATPLISLKRVEEEQGKQEAMQAKKKDALDQIIKAHVSKAEVPAVEVQEAVRKVK